MNSTTITADANGNLLTETRYSAFGEIRYTNGITVTDKMYTGQQQETEIGLDYYIARFYDPVIGHFIQPDSLIPQASASASYDRYYTGEYTPIKPLISPIFADLRGLPPILIHAGTNEILLNQIKEFSEKAREANVELTLETWPGLFHVFQITPFLPESKLSLDKIADFIAEKLGKTA